MKVKIFSLVSVAICAVLSLCGCGKDDSALWYPVDDGFINLKNVTNISSEFSLVLKKNDNRWHWEYPQIRGTISKKNIYEAKKLVEKNEFSSVDYNAVIYFDKKSVKLQKLEKFESKKDILNLLDSWLKSVEELEDVIN